MKFYNPVYSVKIVPYTAFTGSLNPDGEIPGVGDKIIKQKTNAVFYSFAKSFVIPKQDENTAIKEYNRLKSLYPSRSLKIISAENIDDILNRRDIVEIIKRNPVVRTGRFIAKNLASTFIVLLLISVMLFLFILDLDSNPASLSADGSTLFVKNKNDKVLWTKIISVDKSLGISERLISDRVRIVDINSDGENEVIINGEGSASTGNYDNQSILRCYDKGGNELWKDSFKDKVSSKRENLNSEYNIKILDTLTIFGKKSLYLISSNGPSFSSAIYRIDISNGKRLPGTFWASGHMMDAYIKDIDNDKKPEIVGTGYDNGYEDLVFFVYEIDTLTKVRPTTEDYLVEGFPLSELNAYIRFPKIDYDNYIKVRTPSYLTDGFLYRDNIHIFQFGTSLPPQYNEMQLGYEIDYNLKDIDINFSSSFRVQRDTLVAHGLLKPPYTDSREYREIIKNNILYWKNGRWLKKTEFD